MIEWRFKPNSRDDMDVDPIQGEFFTTRDIDNISTAVVREGIQNALDERNRGEQTETVRVRIFLSGDDYAVAPKDYLPLIETLLPHLRAKASGLQSLPDFTQPMKFLLFEDFNTKGLEGNPLEFYVENNNDRQPHNFYYFWRNVGRSGKTDDKLGRWGLGKTVFPASSKINTFWGLTVRKSDQRRMLVGQSILRIHNREDEKKQESGYKPYGMFGNYKSTDCFAEPIEDENELGLFENLDLKQSGTRVMFVNFGAEEEKFCLKEIKKLRSAGINAELYPDQAKMKKQLAYADANKIPYVILIGSEEMTSGIFTIKNMNSGEQFKKRLEDVMEELKG